MSARAGFVPLPTFDAETFVKGGEWWSDDNGNTWHAGSAPGPNLAGGTIAVVVDVDRERGIISVDCK